MKYFNLKLTLLILGVAFIAASKAEYEWNGSEWVWTEGETTTVIIKA